MKKLLLSLLLVLPLSALAAPMTNEDVIRMVKGGLSDATVLQAIENAEPRFDTSPDGLVMLKQGGVSDAVIQRILGRRGSAPVAAPAICVECGTVTGIREINKPGQASGVGAVAGGVHRRGARAPDRRQRPSHRGHGGRRRRRRGRRPHHREAREVRQDLRDRRALRRRQLPHLHAGLHPSWHPGRARSARERRADAAVDYKPM